MSNSGGSLPTAPGRDVTVDVEMAAYDSLPADARRELQQMPVALCALTLAEDIQKGAPASMLAGFLRNWRSEFMALPRALRGWPE